VTIYGIVEEPSAEELKEYNDYVTNLANSALRPDFACWLLLLLSREHSESLDRLLFTGDSLKAVSEYFKTADNSKKITALQLLSNLLQGMQRLPSVSATILAEVLKLRENVTEVSTNLYRSDTGNGSDTTKISKLLQLCVQLIVVIDAFASSMSGNSGGATPRAPLSTKSTQASIAALSRSSSSRGSAPTLPEGMTTLDGDDNSFLHAQDGKGIMRWLPEALPDNLELANSRRILRRKPITGSEGADVYSTAIGKYGFESGIHSFNVRVAEYTNGEPIVGIAMLPVSPAVQLGTSADQVDVAWGSQKLFVRGNEPINFGPIIRPGDIVSITIDVGKGTVTFSRNSALIGLAVGPPNSGAVIEMSLGAGPFYPAVSLRNFGDIVEFVNVPFSSDPKGLGSATADRSSIVPDWMKPLKDSVATMKSFLSREVPQNILTTRFLPVCLRKATSTVRLEATGANTSEICLSEATAMCVFFGELSMGENDLLRIIDDVGNVVFEKKGMEASSPPADPISAALSLFGSGSAGAGSAGETKISAGSTVVRGPSWCYGDQDGGIGSVGTVTLVQEWKGTPNCGVVVSWTGTGASGLYRWNYNGENDVQVASLVDAPVSAPKSSVSSSGAVVVSSNKLVFELIADTTDSAAFVCAQVVPKLSLTAAMNSPEFEPLLSYLRAQYLGISSLQGDIAMVRHIDNRAKGLSMSLSSLLTSKWDSFKPSDTELSKSSALKLLTESPNIPYPDGFEQISIKAGGADDTNGPSDIIVVTSNGCRTCTDCVALATQLGGSLPTREEIRARLPWHGGVFSNERLLWPTADGPDEWTNVGCDPEDESTMESLAQASEAPTFEGEEHSDLRRSFGVKLVTCAGGRKCESCNRDTVLSDFNYPGGVYWCNTCSGANYCSDSRWYCPYCQSDYCYTCQPLQLNQSGKQPTTNELSGGNLVTMTGCTMTGVRADCNIDFDSITDALGCNLLLEPPLPGIVFDPSAGKFYLREGEVVPSATGCVVFKARGTTEMTRSVSSGSSSAAGNTVAESPVEARFSVIRGFNGELDKALPLIDLTQMDQPGTIASLLSLCRGLIFDAVKYPMWESALAATQGSGGQFELRLSRSRARKFASSGQVDDDGRYMVFSQAFRQIHPSKYSLLLCVFYFVLSDLLVFCCCSQCQQVRFGVATSYTRLSSWVNVHMMLVDRTESHLPCTPKNYSPRACRFCCRRQMVDTQWASTGINGC
jgi:hypothetical protein